MSAGISSRGWRALRAKGSARRNGAARNSGETRASNAQLLQRLMRNYAPRSLHSPATRGIYLRQTPETLMADIFENPLGTDGFEFVEFTSPDPHVLAKLFESLGFTAVCETPLQERASATSRATSTSS